MPYSDPSNILWISWVLNEVNPNTVLDIGAGAGKYGKLTKEFNPDIKTTAVEIWAPYVKQFDLESIYDQVHICDARIYPDFKFDLGFLGDVLEHMTKAEAVELWEKVSKEALVAVLSVPIVHYPQGEYENNPYEIHVKDDWTHEEVMKTFPGITAHRTFDVTGIYMADFCE